MTSQSEPFCTRGQSITLKTGVPDKGMTQVAEHLPSKHKALSSIASINKKENNKNEKKVKKPKIKNLEDYLQNCITTQRVVTQSE
jgi:hypothetical protein